MSHSYSLQKQTNLVWLNIENAMKFNCDEMKNICVPLQLKPEQNESTNSDVCDLITMTESIDSLTGHTNINIIITIRWNSIDSNDLFQDVLVESPANEESPLNENSVTKLQQIAEAFFKKIDENVNINSPKDLKSIITVLDASCKRNHIR